MKYKEGDEIKNNKTNEIGAVVKVDKKNKRIKARFVSEGEVWLDYSRIGE